jgi:hypothetical protein
MVGIVQPHADELSGPAHTGTDTRRAPDEGKRAGIDPAEHIQPGISKHITGYVIDDA